MNKSLPATISLRFVKHNVNDTKGNLIDPFEWNCVPAEVDLHDNKIKCEVEVDLIEAMGLTFSADDPEITALSIKYNGVDYAVDVTKCKAAFSSQSQVTFGTGGKTQRAAIAFSLQESVLSLKPCVGERKNYLVFSGAYDALFEMTLQRRGRNFHFSSPRGSDLLTVSSDDKFSEDDWLLMILAFSLFQNARITLLESHTETEFLLYIQLPPPAGIRLCPDETIFLLLWQWLIENDRFLLQRNMLEFFLSGTRNHGDYVDFRLLNLFVCMDSICGNEGRSFGKRISDTFGVSKGDGHWLAYVRNHMVHAGASISEAIAGAFADFSRKQIPRGLSLSRYAAYSTATNKQKLPFALYCDVIDLIMAYFMKVIGYSLRIDKMSVLFNITIK